MSVPGQPISGAAISALAAPGVVPPPPAGGVFTYVRRGFGAETYEVGLNIMVARRRRFTPIRPRPQVVVLS